VVNINQQPVVDEPANVQACGSYTLQPLTVGSYYASPGGVDPITNNEITATQTIYVYAQTGDASTVLCSDESSFVVTINTAPTTIDVTPLSMCDDNFDGIACFNLAPAGAQAINGQGGLTVTYHETMADALAGANAIPTPSNYCSISTGNQPIYISVVQTGTTTNCRSVEPLQLIVEPRPAVPVMTDYALCDAGADGTETFDLTTKTAQASGGNTGYTVTYYTSQAGALAGTTPISPANAFPSAGQQVWVRIQSGFGCATVSSFDLIVNPLPVYNQDPAELVFSACEEEPDQGYFNLDDMAATVTDGAPGYAVTYYATQAQAQSGTGPQLTGNYLSATKVIYARLTDVATGCASTTPLQLNVIAAPIAPVLTPLEECDLNNDHFALFNLNAAIQQITDALGTGVATITIHETLYDAQFNANALSQAELDSYQNIDPDHQTLYVRVQAIVNGPQACYDIAELELIVNPVPEAVTPQDYALCDNGVSDADGEGIFDLTTKITEILGGLNPAQYSVSFHSTSQGAQSNTDIIAGPGAYATTSSIVWVRVTNNATGCFDVVELQLTVNPLPVVTNPTPYSLCDDNPGAEVEEFDLTTKIDEITGGVSGVHVTFHTTNTDAQGGTNAITNITEYVNTPPVQTLFVRVTDDVTGCYRVVLLDVRVEPIPVLYPPADEDLVVCDTNGGGIGTFDLEAIAEQMTNNGLDLQVSFHRTQYDAQNNLNPITGDLSQFQNDTPFLQHIWVRVVNTQTGCQGAAFELTLEVRPAPQVPVQTDITICDDQDSNSQDNHAWFNLDQKTQGIRDALGDATLIVHYFTTEAAANTGSPRITTPEHYWGTGEQVIWVRVEDAQSGCYSITSFTLHLNLPLTLATNLLWSKCNEDLPNDGKAEFNLRDKENDILGPFGVGQGYIVAYYTDAAHNNPIADPEHFTNTENAQTVFVVVTSPQGCVSTGSLTLRVLALPQPNMTPQPLVKCDDNGNNDHQEEFDLTDAADDIRANDPSLVLSYYPSHPDADAKTHEITLAQAQAYVSGNDTLYVRVEGPAVDSNGDHCYQVVPLILTVNGLPVLGDPADGTIEPFAYCDRDIPTTGVHTFILSDHTDKILIGLDASDYTVTFFEDRPKAVIGTQALPNLYTNTINPEPIWVRVVNNETGCVNIGTFNLVVEDAAIAHPVPAGTIDAECDTDGVNDGKFEFDLTPAGTIALGSQPAADYSVHYYESEALANANDFTTAIPDPEHYTNSTPDDMVIWIVITHTTTQTQTGCPDKTSITLHVDRLPEATLTGGTICVDYTTGEVLRENILDTGLDTTHTFVWYRDGAVIAGATGPSYSPDQPGEYTVVITSAAYCQSEPIAPVTIEMSGPATPVGAGYTVTNAFSDNQVITIAVEGYGSYEYSIDGGPWQTDNVFTGVAPGPHDVQVRDTATDNPCQGPQFNITLEDISTIDYPNFFTPNGDGIHDTWNIIGLGDQAAARIYIFDRYGKLIKQISSDGEGWDGTYNGTPLPSTDYWFSVQYVEDGVNKEFKAHFTMKR
jgi:gliding motility-associated-like protein